MRKFWGTSVAAATLIGFSANFVSAQNPVERRLDRNLRQADRQAQRIGNRSTYYTDNTWKQVSPWVSKYDLRPVQRAANVAANAAANVAANTAANARFGYANPAAASTPSGWFYDYYSVPYANFTPGAGTNNAYSSAHIFNDANNDGVYDEFYTYRDSDNKGRFDEYDQYEFADTKKERVDTGSHNGLYDARRHTISGRIDASKSSKVNGSMHTVIRVKGDKESTMVVDLGPSTALNAVKAEVGQDIVASGPIMQIGDKEVMMAESAQISSKEVVIARSAPQITGVVLDSTLAEVQNGSHSMVVVKSDKGNQLIDLGNADQLRVKIAPQSQIVVWGVPVQMRDHSVILADKIELNGQTYPIKRW
ncbi:MAG TPA: hypothetical protein VM260_14485 [Pirellula sp.]|nr:hypothetical protein [Pirellula sp.]